MILNEAADKEADRAREIGEHYVEALHIKQADVPRQITRRKIKKEADRKWEEELKKEADGGSRSMTQFMEWRKQEVAIVVLFADEHRPMDDD